MKICRRCKIEKDENEFGILKCSKDGINPRCKKCCIESVKNSKKSPDAIEKKKRYVAEWQKRNTEKRKEQCRQWYSRNLEKAREMSLEATKKYLATDHGKKKRNQRSSEWDNKNPEKRRAHDRAMYAVKTEKLFRPNFCSQCKKECKPHAHHEDYSKALDVIWLCQTCHFYLHHKHKHHAERSKREDTRNGDAVL